MSSLWTIIFDKPIPSAWQLWQPWLKPTLYYPSKITTLFLVVIKRYLYFIYTLRIPPDTIFTTEVCCARVAGLHHRIRLLCFATTWFSLRLTHCSPSRLAAPGWGLLCRGRGGRGPGAPRPRRWAADPGPCCNPRQPEPPLSLKNRRHTVLDHFLKSSWSMSIKILKIYK